MSPPTVTRDPENQVWRGVDAYTEHGHVWVAQVDLLRDDDGFDVGIYLLVVFSRDAEGAEVMASVRLRDFRQPGLDSPQQFEGWYGARTRLLDVVGAGTWMRWGEASEAIEAVLGVLDRGEP